MNKKKWSKVEKALLAAPLLLLIMPILSQFPRQDFLDKKTQFLAEPNAVDCGRASSAKVPDSMMACAVASFKTGKAFKFRFDRVPNSYKVMGMDNLTSFYIGSSKGGLSIINYAWNRNRFGMTMIAYSGNDVNKGKCKIRFKDGREEVYPEETITP